MAPEKPRRTALCIVLMSLTACGAAGSRGDQGREAEVESGEGVAGGPSDPRCLPQGGYADDACDRCENASCCEARFDCYDEGGCGAAADALEECAARAGSDEQAVSRCWNAFAESGPRAQARVACQRAHCAVACEVPP
jgi:hypothetical protein